jgi:D-lactate dehydrogenase
MSKDCIAVYSTHGFDRNSLESALGPLSDITWITEELTLNTAGLAAGCRAVGLFTSDTANAAVLEMLRAAGTEWILLRSAGYNHVDVEKARALGMKVARVPAYSPEAIAEHALTLLLALNRHIPEADRRVHKFDFHLEGLTGQNMQDMAVGVVGLGKIGKAFARLCRAFGGRVLGYDMYPDKTWAAELGIDMVPLDELLQMSDAVSLHVPASPATHHLFGRETMAKCKRGVTIINTARGDVIDAEALLEALETGQVAAAGLDVHEFEKGLFFYDYSGKPCPEPTIERLLQHPRVLLTAHQAFLTDRALGHIAQTTADNLRCFMEGRVCENAL